ncbi:MAG: hypothetical protein JW985_01905 [Alphaproteobacteria bacterium]|nr:hypothetical protein [Alphaproteobacteria bacterium]
MENLTPKEQSDINIAKIIAELNKSHTELIDLKTLCLNPTILNGHINFEYFESLEEIRIIMPYKDKSYNPAKVEHGITSIDLSHNLDFTQFYCDANVMPNFQEFKLAHPNQIPYKTVYGEQNILKALHTAKKQAYVRNISNMFENTNNVQIKQILQDIKITFNEKQKYLEMIDAKKKEIEELNILVDKNSKLIDEYEKQVAKLLLVPEVPTEITFKQLPCKFMTDLGLCTPFEPLAKIRTNNEIKLAKMRAERGGK